MSEHDAVAALSRLANRWPKSLWLFAASGRLNVMRKNERGERALTGDGMDPAYSVAEIGIEADGGDW